MIIRMGDDSRKSPKEDSIRNEWLLFWESIAKNEDPKKEELGHAPLKVLTVEEIQKLTKTLSQSRRQLNRKLENLNKEIELNTAKLESLQLVGQNGDDTYRRVQELTEQGQSLTMELIKLDETLRHARSQDDSADRA